MPFDFPNSPTLNQTAIAPNGATFVWDGQKWTTAENVVMNPGAGLYLPLSGGNLTGSLGVNGEIIPMRLNLGGANGNGLGITLSPTQGLDHTGTPIWLNYYFSGTNSGVNNQNFNTIIVNDNVSYSGSGQSNALFIQQYLQANATRGGGLWVDVEQIAAPTGLFGFCTALTAASSLAYNCGGTSIAGPSTLKGVATTFNTYTALKPGATFISGLVGYEMDIHAQVGASFGVKTGLLIARLSDDAVFGAFGMDAAIQLGGTGGTTAGWDYGLLLSAPNTQISFKPTATLIGCAEPQTPSTGQALAAWGIDFAGLVFSGGFARSLGFLVDGSGNVTAQRFSMSNWSFTPSATGLAIAAAGQRASLTSIANGGAAWTVGDKVRTANGGIYQITAASAGVATTVVQLVPDVAASPPANPVTTTATAANPLWHSSGAGLTLNLAWTAANAVSIAMAAAATDAAAATAGVPIGGLYNNAGVVHVRLT